MKSKIDSMIQDGLKKGVFTACELLVSSNSKKIFHTRLGEPSRELFDIASLTKPICTAAIYTKLLENGLLKNTDKISEWLGRARLAQHKRITLKMLLEHRSGLRAYEPYYLNIPKDSLGSIKSENLMTMLSLMDPQVQRELSATIYSDIGYIILGKILEEATSLKLDELFQKEIAGPLELKKTFFVRNKKKKGSFVPTEAVCEYRKRKIEGEVDDLNAFAMGGVAGHAGLFSNCEDINKFIAEYVASYNETGGFFNKEILRELIDFSKVKDLKSDNYIGGWNLPTQGKSSSGRFFSEMTIGHLGHTGCSVWIDLLKNFWVILLTNRTYTNESKKPIQIFRPQIHDLIYKELIEARRSHP